MFEKLKKIYGFLFFKIFSLLHHQNIIIFSCFSGKRYGDNARIVSKYIDQKYPNIKQVWFYHDNKFNEIPNHIKQVKWGSIKMIYYLSIAKIWISTHTLPVWVYKNKNQFYLNTWHGGLGMKKIGLDSQDVLEKKEISRMKHNSEMVDLFISNSKWLSDIYERAFWYKGIISVTGYPKDDYLLNIDKRIIKENVYRFFNLDSKTKIVLYAPTMREHPKEESFLNINRFIIQLNKKDRQNNWKILYRFHPVNADYASEIGEEENIINATNYQDILNLIVASDFFITDYSSCIFDAALIGKKAVIYANDEEEYRKERGLYINLEELPFPVARNEEKLINDIISFDYEEYKRRVKKYYEKVEYLADGKATERISDIVIKKIKEI